MSNLQVLQVTWVLTGKSRVLLALLVVYVVLDILLTPPAGLETRNPALVTSLGLLVLGLLFVGLAISIAFIVLLFYKPLRSPALAIAAGIFYFPAFITEQAGYFSALKPPVAIETVEILQALVSILTIITALSVYRQKQA